MSNSMAEKIEKDVGLTHVISFLALLLSIVFFLYVVFYRNADRHISHFESLIRQTDMEISAIRKLMSQQDRNVKTSYTEPVKQYLKADPPTFLEKIQTQFIASGLELDHIEKLEKDDYTYQFVAYASFERLLDFLFRIEQSNFVIQDLDVHPYARDKNLINITLRVIRHEMYPDEKRAFLELQEQFPKTIRDPFKKNGLIRATDRTTMVNLTWKYNLTGIGFDKARYATIDHRNYYNGDVFHGMRITRIHSERVDLESGSQKYFLTFRHRPQQPGS